MGSRNCRTLKEEKRQHAAEVGGRRKVEIGRGRRWDSRDLRLQP